MPTSHIIVATRAAIATFVALVLSQGLPTTAHQADWQPMLYDEQIGRGQAEHDDWVPVDAVTQPTPPASREVLVHGQCVDVPDSAALEIA